MPTFQVRKLYSTTIYELLKEVENEFGSPAHLDCNLAVLKDGRYLVLDYEEYEGHMYYTVVLSDIRGEKDAETSEG